MNEWLFYLLTAGGGGITIQPELPAGYVADLWRPSVSSLVPHGMTAACAAWWLMHQTRLFRNRDYSVLTIRHQGDLVHRSMVFPGYFRFPFMDVNDLQVGDTWTSPDHRRRGLATVGLSESVRRLAVPGRRFWYLVERQNISSIRVVEKVGFQHAGSGHRSSRLGFRLFGQFLMDKKS